MKQIHQRLKAKQRAERDSYPGNLGLRIHRALSWLDRASQCDEDLDAEFIFLWISFNASYADDFSAINFSETGTFKRFISKLCVLDKAKQIENLVWCEFSSSIRLLLANKYLFHDFWSFNRGDLSETEWEERFLISKNKANKALSKKNSVDVLIVIFSRLFTLRNQLIHGGATWNGALNREQIRDGVNFMRKLLPLVIDLMMDNPKELWGEPSYPVVL